MPYNLLVYKNGELLYTIAKTTTTSLSNYLIFNSYDIANDLQWQGDYTFKVEGNEILTFSNIKLETIFYEDIDGLVYQTNYNQVSTQTTSNLLAIANYFPILKIESNTKIIIKPIIIITIKSNKSFLLVSSENELFLFSKFSI